MAAWITVASAIGGIIAGGTLTYFTSRSQLYIQAEHAYDRALRDLRIPHYQALFHLTGSIPRQWLIVETPRRPDLHKIREQLHSWYFSEQAGGMFLSQEARETYFSLQNELLIIATRMTDDDQLIGEQESIVLRKTASALRHQLTADLGTAERPRPAWTAPRNVPLPTAPRQANADK
jgi:predicted ribosomally synthesized peptide with SipW-like signal peptide